VAVALEATDPPPGEEAESEEHGRRAARFGDDVVDAAVVRGVPDELDGPAIVELPESTVVVPPGWRASAVAGGLRMERARSTR
jgi:N-methylhydantoinase A